MPSDETPPPPGRAGDDGDGAAPHAGFGQGLEPLAEVASAAAVHGVANVDPLNLAYGQVRHAAGRVLLAAYRDFSSDPAGRAWLDRPRSRRAVLVALLAGCCLAALPRLVFGPAGAAVVGYLLCPLLAPCLASTLSRRLWHWFHRVRFRPQRRDAGALVGGFLWGVTLTVCAVDAAPAAHGQDGGGLLLIGPFMAVLFVVPVLPLMYALACDANRVGPEASGHADTAEPQSSA